MIKNPEVPNPTDPNEQVTEYNEADGTFRPKEIPENALKSDPIWELFNNKGTLFLCISACYL